MKKVARVWGQLLILVAIAATVANGMVSFAATAEQQEVIKDPAEYKAYISTILFLIHRLAKFIHASRRFHWNCAVLQANQVDLVITMENPMQTPPGNGAMVAVIGVFTGYQLNPFFFSMAQGKLETEPAKTEEVYANM